MNFIYLILSVLSVVVRLMKPGGTHALAAENIAAEFFINLRIRDTQVNQQSPLGCRV